MVVAVIGAGALYALFVWLACAIVAGYLAQRKGYEERYGLAAGLLLTVVGVLIWLLWPAKPESDWKVVGPFGRGKSEALDLIEEHDRELAQG
jgi:fucose permease